MSCDWNFERIVYSLLLRKFSRQVGDSNLVTIYMLFCTWKTRDIRGYSGGIYIFTLEPAVYTKLAILASRMGLNILYNIIIIIIFIIISPSTFSSSLSLSHFNHYWYVYYYYHYFSLSFYCIYYYCYNYWYYHFYNNNTNNENDDNATNKKKVEEKIRWQ